MTELIHTHSMTLDSTPGRVFDALTDPEDLKVWFAEHVDVEPRLHGRFRFWGRHTYETPGPAEANAVIREFEPGRTIAFDWPLAGREAIARLDVEPEGEKTKLIVTHTFRRAPAMDRAREMVDDLWRMHFGALMCHLMGAPVSLPDFTETAQVVESSIYIDAPRSIVFRAFTDPALLNQWIAKDAKVDLDAGTLDFGWSYEANGQTVVPPPMRILEIEQDRKFVTNWPDWRGDPDVPDQRVTWHLEDEGKGTRLTLRHDGFIRPTDISDYPFGWSYFLSQIKSVSEKSASA
ncbi:MAG: hypothetical protein CMF74_09230 [Maricaulis sp.]|jgi:uncharacterized protein YndB with AHSA1/START domain|nr:hypothetical protein [Maricaulis sp.]